MSSNLLRLSVIQKICENWSTTAVKVKRRFDPQIFVNQLMRLGFLRIHQLSKKSDFFAKGVFFLLTSPLMGDPYLFPTIGIALVMV